MSIDTRRAPSPPPAPAGGRITLRQNLRDSLVVAKRNLLRMLRIPETVVFGLIQPIMFVVLFAYVFGGSISIPGAGLSASAYREFLMGGIFAQTVTFATAGAAAGIAEDMQKGIIDRFRSLPMARGAVLTGRTFADLAQTAVILVVLAVVAFLVGWRIHDGPLSALAAFGLLLLLGYAFTWIGALIGLSVRTPEAATSGGLVWLFPLTFISVAFVPSENMPGWLQPVAEWNPFSATVLAVRDLFGNLPPDYRAPDVWPMQHPALASVLWSVLIIVIFRTLAVRKYQRATG
ncbi:MULTISPECIES: ABC transporter permease [Streptomyces]|uniref:Transport permease protein n=1 Tax=Streptomyces carpaticus TaxID=285558 RepID=A0ABV4ZL87_9ACTN|nr:MULTISPECIES: ABC transporter permease [Streptomyces]MCK1816177.1 ABC transporter permease [Streptomyces sp. XM4011]UWM50859.1 ABC transporter permease [Streptomyces carpaticus]